MQSPAELVTSDIPDDPPEGYRRIPTGTGFNQLVGPVYGRLDDGRLIIGMRIGHRHINPHQTTHGGVLASFADMQVYAAQMEPDLSRMLLPTISMTIDYISPAVLGDWLEGHTSLIRVTRSMLFQQTLAMVGERTVFRASGIYKVSNQDAPAGSALGDLFRD